MGRPTERHAGRASASQGITPHASGLAGLVFMKSCLTSRQVSCWFPLLPRERKDVAHAFGQTTRAICAVAAQRGLPADLHKGLHSSEKCGLFAVSCFHVPHCVHFQPGSPGQGNRGSKGIEDSKRTLQATVPARDALCGQVEPIEGSTTKPSRVKRRDCLPLVSFPTTSIQRPPRKFASDSVALL